MEFDLLPYNLSLAFAHWGFIVGIIAAIAVLLAFLMCIRLGPSGLTMFGRGLRGYLGDIVGMSPRRILAVAGLTLKEAVRRKALMVFVLFAIVLMFAGWFMSSGNDRESLEVGVQIWFLLTAISWLLLPAVMFLSCWSIPEDIRVRSLHTVVTKPIRRIEVVVGRIVGFGTVMTLVVLVMGAAGYVWIQRQVSDEVREQLTCRVPQFGFLIFKDREGQMAQKGINTGDLWTYRSYIEGNSRARAIWAFRDVTAERFPSGVNLESRFEAFRSIKGTEESMLRGIEGQFILVNALREDAFGAFAAAPTFLGFSNELVEGQFRNAAISLSEIAESMAADPESDWGSDCRSFGKAAEFAEEMLSYVGEGDQFEEVRNAFKAVSDAGREVSDPADPARVRNFAGRCSELADVLKTRSDELIQEMPNYEVPLPTFNVTEYHEGQDVYTIPRKLSFVADYESLSRYLAQVIRDANEQQNLVSNGALADGLAEQLSGNTDLSVLNSELLVDVLQEEIDEGTLEIADGQLTVADGRIWITYFDQLLRAERLTSQDPAGWVLTADLFEDLTTNDALRIEVACLGSQMFLGMARPDLFIRLPDRGFLAGYAKALLSTILMLLLVIVIGVTASTIVKGPVALFFTFGVFLIGQTFHGFMSDILEGYVPGAGLVESATLLFQQRAPSAGVDATQQAQDIIQTIDKVPTAFLHVANGVIPDFGLFSRSAAYVENGFDVPWSTTLLPAIVTFFGFLIPCVLLASAFLKFRELEAK